MADCKIISATAKEPVINVSDGAKVATAEVKEIVSNVQAVSIAPTIPTGCIQTNLSGFGEGWIPDPTLFTFRQDKSIVNEYFSKSIRKSAKDIVEPVEFKSIGVSKTAVDVADSVETFRKTIELVIQEIDYFLEDYTSFDYTMHGVNTTDVIKSIGVSKTVQDKSIVNEYFSKSVSKSAKDIVRFTETVIKIVTAKLTSDTFRTSDTFSRVVAFKRVISDTKSTVEVLAKSFSKVLKDTADQVEKISKAFSTTLANDLTRSSDKATLLFGLYKTDTTRTSDVFSRIVSYNRTLTDITDQIEQIRKAFSTSRTEVADANEFKSIGVSKTAVDVADQAETWRKTIELVIQEIDYFSEDYTSFDYTMYDVNTTDVITDVRIAKVITDSIDATDDFYGNANIDDDQTAQITKVINDYADPIEVFSRTVSYNRTFTESFSKSETFGKTLSLRKSDLIDPVEVFTKAGSKVINDAISKVEYKIAHMQGYFSGGYVAADYVGTNYTI